MISGDQEASAALNNNVDEVSVPIPNLLSTPERWRARFNAYYEGKKNMVLKESLEPTPEDFEAYKKKFPEEGVKLDKMARKWEIIKYGTLIGTGSCVGLAMRWTRTKPYLVVTGLTAMITSFFTSSEIGTLVYGTYKFDIVHTNALFLHWLRDSRPAIVDPKLPAEETTQ